MCAQIVCSYAKVLAVLYCDLQEALDNTAISCSLFPSTTWLSNIVASGFAFLGVVVGFAYFFLLSSSSLCLDWPLLSEVHGVFCRLFLLLITTLAFQFLSWSVLHSTSFSVDRSSLWTSRIQTSHQHSIRQWPFCLEQDKVQCAFLSFPPPRTFLPSI